MPATTPFCTSDDVDAAQRLYDAADLALINFHREHKLTEPPYTCNAEKLKWHRAEAARLLTEFNKARAALTQALNVAANARFGAPSQQYETNPRVKPSWA